MIRTLLLSASLPALLLAGTAGAQGPARSGQTQSQQGTAAAMTSEGGIGAFTPAGVLRPGESGSGTLEDTDPKSFDGTLYDDWTYTGKRGERLSVTLRSAAFDAYLLFGRLEEGRFSYIRAEDDGAGGNDSLLEVTLPADGTYVFRVNTLFAGKGPYTLSLKPDPR